MSFEMERPAPDDAIVVVLLDRTARHLSFFERGRPLLQLGGGTGQRHLSPARHLG